MDEKQQSRIISAFTRIAFTLGASESWDADTLEDIADLVGKVAPHPGDEESAVAYLDKLRIAGLPTTRAMRADAESLDAERQEL